MRKKSPCKTPLVQKTIGKGDKKMKSKKAVRSALGMSVLSIALCAAMLIGTTFAWFTDTASTAVNKIQAGTLDVALEMFDTEKNDWVSAEGKTLDFVKSPDAPAGEELLWEPGCTYNLPELKIVNNGNLALKYKVVVSGVNGNSKLLKVIDFSVTKQGTGDTPETIDLTDFEGILLPAGKTAGAGEEAGETTPITISGYMKKEAGNEYQGESIDGIAITVYATQYTYEFDSKDNQYDEGSAYKGTQEFTSGEHTLNKGGVALNPNDVAVKVSGEGTQVTITGGYYDGGSGGDNRCIQVDTGATVIIKDGTFTVGGDATGLGNSVVLCNGGTVEIEGGFFQTDYAYRNFYYVLNQQNGNPGTITVKGGTFVNYDPSKGDDNLHGNFVADGYAVVSETKANGDVWYTVVKTVENQNEVNDSITSGTKGENVTVALPKNSSFTLDNGIAHEGTKSRDITFVGDGTQTVDVVSNAVNASEGNEMNYQRGSTFTFENVKVQAGTTPYGGIVCDEVTFKNCTITGKLALYGKATFENCVFENDMADQYSIWTWGGTDVKFEGCTFNTNGKAILLYGGATYSNPTNLTVNNCVFNDRNNGSAGKAAIEIGNDYNATYTLTVNNATVNGFANGKNTGSKLWANKNSMDAAHLTVTIDGTKVQ